MELGAHEDQPCNAWRQSLGDPWQRYTKMVMGTFACGGPRPLLAAHWQATPPISVRPVPSGLVRTAVMAPEGEKAGPSASRN